MAKLRTPHIEVISALESDTTNLRLAHATYTLLEAIRILDWLVKPKHFIFSDAKLREFSRISVDGSHHYLRAVDDEPIAETTEWQVFGQVGDRIVNVIARSTFHTHAENRSGSTDFFINGKPNMRPEYGGVTVDDIWQATGLHKQFDGATTLSITTQDRRGKTIKELT